MATATVLVTVLVVTAPALAPAQATPPSQATAFIIVLVVTVLELAPALAKAMDFIIVRTALLAVLEKKQALQQLGEVQIHI